MNLQRLINKRDRKVRYLLSVPLEIRRFRHDRLPCPKGCDCKGCKAYLRVLQAIREAQPKAYPVPVVTAKQTT